LDGRKEDIFVGFESPDVPGDEVEVPLLGDGCWLGCGVSLGLVSASRT